MKIAVFGLGFVGLTTAVGFANKDIKVSGYEISKEKVEMLKNGNIPFFEKDLNEALNNAIKTNLTITSDIIKALDSADIVFYCIGTPMSDDGSADLSFILNALQDTANHIKLCKEKPILVIKSTIPPGSLKDVFLPFLQALGLVENRDFILANNPEFLREGYAYDDFMNPDRIVIGADFKIDKIIEIYSKFNAQIIFVSPNTAEFIKYLSNTMLSMMISYANDMSIIAKHIGDIDIKKAFEVLHMDKRFFGNPANITSYIYPGMGFGGYCLPKDTFALYKQSKNKGYESKLIKEILNINDAIIDYHIANIQENRDVNIGILGLSFKPNSDDVRDSKSLLLIQKLIAKGYKNIYAFDPLANHSFKKTYSIDIKYTNSLNEIINSCEALIIATAWSDFKNLDVKNKRVYNLRYI